MKADLLSTRIRLAIREELVGWTLGAIGDLFQSEGFVADANHDPRVSGERRTYVEQFYVRHQLGRLESGSSDAADRRGRPRSDEAP